MKIDPVTQCLIKIALLKSQQLDRAQAAFDANLLTRRAVGEYEIDLAESQFSLAMRLEDVCLEL